MVAPTRRSRYIPSRGDIVWLQFDPQAGHEQAGRRPAVVLSPVGYTEKVGLALVCPIISQVKGYPFEVVLSGNGATGAALADQVKNLDWKSRQAERKGATTPVELAEIKAKIKTLLKL